MWNLAWMQANMGQCNPHLFPLFSHFIYWAGEAFSQKLQNKLMTIWFHFVQMKWGRGSRVGFGSVLKSIKIICLKYQFTNLLSFTGLGGLHWFVADHECLNQSVFTAHCEWGVAKSFRDMAASAGGEHRRKKKQQERARSPTFRENQWENDWDFAMCSEKCASPKTKRVLPRRRNLRTTRVTPGFDATERVRWRKEKPRGEAGM